MKYRRGSYFILATALLGLAVAPQARGGDVHAAKVSMQGAVPDDVGGQPTITVLKVSGNNLLNVAMGRDRRAPVPKNQVLALVIDCSSRAAGLGVYDTTAHAPLVTIATNSANDYFEGTTSGAFAMKMDLLETGNNTNRVTGGYLIVAGSYKRDGRGCPVSIKATMLGRLDVMVTDDIGTHGLPFVITKATLSTGKAPIDTWP
jgi:hypothetical protein